MKTTLVNDALLMALKRRKPAKGLIWHTDRGSHVVKRNPVRSYASYSHKDLIDSFIIELGLTVI